MILNLLPVVRLRLLVERRQNGIGDDTRHRFALETRRGHRMQTTR